MIRKRPSNSPRDTVGSTEPGQSESTTVKVPRISVVIVVMVVATLGFRALLAWVGNFGPADLETYEAVSGVDLPDRYGELPFFLFWTEATVRCT